jgi:deoxyribodipyrimidine photo-lyase
MSKHHLVWLRGDLRVADHPAFHAACSDADSHVTALYAYTPKQWQQHDVAAVRIDFEWRQLHSLANDLAALNIALVVLIADTYSMLVPKLLNWCQTHRVSSVFAHEAYELNEQARDVTVRAELAACGIESQWFHDNCIIPPGRVLTNDGRYYTVFTPFKRNWLMQLAERPIELLPVPTKRQASVVEASPLADRAPGIEVPISDELVQTLWAVGEAQAHMRLAQFISEDGGRYNIQRNLPAVNGTSTLSPYLAAGIISARQCLFAAEQHARRHAGQQGLETWISELCWRDFYKHILVGFPHVCRHQAFKRNTDVLPWSKNTEHFQAWCAGRTGFPIVDAAMRQLNETGWMHNRLRMITAMFLTKDLFIDWRLGERYFMQHLIDGDLSANNGGWQWSASTGNDAAPYFRIFNPFLQSKKSDPDGEFIRRFVPELAELDAKRIHEPHAKGLDVGLQYPEPIVDHARARLDTLAYFKALGNAATEPT